MWSTRHLLRIRKFPSCLCHVKNWPNKILANNFSDEKQTPEHNQTLGDMGKKYRIFKEDESLEILDVNEERFKYSELLEAEPEEPQDPFEGLNLDRGQRGVFEIEDLVQALKRENAENIFVAAVPPEIKYVDYICVVSGKSTKHMLAIVQFIRKVFKRKRHDYDFVPKMEGKDSTEWLALDLGNIALHVFSKEARRVYDLESLWSVGPKYDNECNKKDEIVTVLERHSVYLDDLTPAS